ncbi:MAG: tRNA-binding protein [Vulcanimicrobiaceae bacterium]
MEPESAARDLTPDEFERVEIRVGTIVDAQPFSAARKPAYQLAVDFGETLGVRNSSAQIVANYELETLVGRQVLAIVNFPPKRIAGFRSEVLVLGVNDPAGNVVLAGLERAVPNGARLY